MKCSLKTLPCYYIPASVWNDMAQWLVRRYQYIHPSLRTRLSGLNLEDGKLLELNWWLCWHFILFINACLNKIRDVYNPQKYLLLELDRVIHPPVFPTVRQSISSSPFIRFWLCNVESYYFFRRLRFFILSWSLKRCVFFE